MDWNHAKPIRNAMATFAALALATAAGGASATSPCGDFGACKALVEINSSDGDIGFHFLKDGDDLRATHIEDPSGQKIFEDRAKGSMVDQKYTEIFGESAEPLCWEAPDADADEEIVTLEDFLERWEPGTYRFLGQSDRGEMSEGETELTFNLPAAPTDVAYDPATRAISWSPGDDLGNCASKSELTDLVANGTLPMHPEVVPMALWEVVFEPEDDSGLKFTLRVPAGVTSVAVPAGFLDPIAANTPAKVEVGAIGLTDNATFTELGGLCINGDACPGD